MDLTTDSRFDLEDEKIEETILLANKEKWLGEMALQFIPYFEAAGKPLPKLRAVCGFTSGGAKSNIVGECWYPNKKVEEAEGDRHVEIFIRPDFDDALEVAAILAHELCHAALGPGFGHGKEYGVLARGLDLQGPLTATSPGPKFKELVGAFVTEIGEPPKGKLDIGGFTPAHPKPKQPSWPKTCVVRCDHRDCDFSVVIGLEFIKPDVPRIQCPVHKVNLLDKHERAA